MVAVLSIIIPTLNEAAALPLLLNDLAAQQGIDFEVIVTDGGSTDQSCALAEQLFATGQLAGRCLTGSPGRGRQLNTGAASACAEWLLFLHADSRLTDPCQLQKAVTFLKSRHRQAETDTLAGRFVLRFDRFESKEGFAFDYYEAKARLGRPGCIHGDQGFLLSRSFFFRVGPFREDLPVMEDTSLAEDIRSCGKWLLLPDAILTSTRRFAVEGIKARQTLNALMMNFLAIGWLDFFKHGADLYCQQDRTRPLQLPPFFRLIAELLRVMPLRRRWSIWMATGAYVRSQGWQLGLILDCRKAHRCGFSCTEVVSPWLDRFDRYFDPLTDHWPGRALTAVLVRVWFACQLRGE